MSSVPKKVATAFLSLWCVPFPSFSATPGRADTVSPIEVSAERYEPRRQTTPSTVNTLSGEQLDASGVGDIKDLQYSVPGLMVLSSGGLGRPVLRGVGSTLSAAGDSGVSIFTDGIYRNSAVHALQGLYDVDRVEVLKGPQGIQLERNVLGGAIQVVTRDPEPYPSAYADMAYGQFNQREFRGAVNQPIGQSDLFFRLAGSVKKRDGYARNILLNQDLDDLNYASWRAKLRYRPSSDLDVVLLGEFTSEHDSAGLAHQPDPNVGVNSGILLGGTVSDDPRKLTYNTGQQQHSHSRLYGLRLTRNLQDLEFRSLTSYQDTRLRTTQDLDGTDIDVASNSPTLKTHALSQEFRLGTQADLPLTWTLGLSFLNEYNAQRSDLSFPLSALHSVSDSTTKSTSFAVFGDLSRLLMPSLRLRAGMRYIQDRRSIDLTQTVDDPLGVQGPPGHSELRQNSQGRWNALTPEVSLLYTSGPDVSYYAKLSRGFKSGGFNAYTAQPSFDPEYLLAYEVGVKARFPSTKLRLNASLFDYDYTDMQLFTLPPGSPLGSIPVIANAAKASIRGLDLELWYRPTAPLQLHAGATLLDARFDKFVSVDPNNPGTDPDRSGDPLPNSPKLSLVAGASYAWELAGGSVELSSTYRYQSSVYFNPYHDTAVRQGGYDLFSAGLRFSSLSDDWYVELQGENLTDRLYTENKIRLDPLVGTSRHWGPPRTVTLRAGMRF